MKEKFKFLAIAIIIMDVVAVDIAIASRNFFAAMLCVLSLVFVAFDLYIQK